MNEYLFSKNTSFLESINGSKISLTKEEFLKIFGTNGNPYNTRKKVERFSWSGSCCPSKFDIWTDSGQKISVDDNKNLVVLYSFAKDKRITTLEILKSLDKEVIKDFENLTIAVWKNEDISAKINNKFNQKGFFICFKNSERNVYDKIGFGSSFNYENFLSYFREGHIFFDSGMYQGNTRNYSQFRGHHKNFWSKLLKNIN